MIIGIGVDSTVCNTTESVLQQHYADTGEKLTLDDTYYEIAKERINKAVENTKSNL